MNPASRLDASTKEYMNLVNLTKKNKNVNILFPSGEMLKYRPNGVLHRGNKLVLTYKNGDVATFNTDVIAGYWLQERKDG